ncbi:MAG: metal-dependent hydrolase [Flammeovirgaceae bacterium]
MKVTYYGHASFSVEVSGKTLFFDPFISPNELAKGVDISQLKADYVLITHGHGDHVADVETIAKQNDSTLISNFEIISWFGEKGLEKGHPMNHGGQASFDFGTVKYVNAVHSSTLPDGSPGGHPGGFIVRTSAGNFYFAGDTALTYDMKLIGEYEQIDFAILPIGDNFTMGIDDAVIAADFINCDKIIGMHYDTFPYIVINHDEAKKKFHDAGKELILLDIGEGIDL